MRFLDVVVGHGSFLSVLLTLLDEVFGEEHHVPEGLKPFEALRRLLDNEDNPLQFLDP